MSDGQPLRDGIERVKIPNFSPFENALAGLIGRITVSRIENNGLSDYFDKNEVHKRLLDWTMEIMRACHHSLGHHLTANVNVTATEFVTRYVMPRFGYTALEINPTAALPIEILRNSVWNDMERVLCCEITFRLVRPTTHHAFKLVTVNLVMEELREDLPPTSPLNLAIHPVAVDEEPEDIPDDEEFDELKPREDVAEDWVRYYTLQDDRFVPGKTRVHTAVDLVHNLTRHDEIGEMARILFGLSHVDINDVDIEGQITVRTKEKGAIVVQGT